LTFLEILCRYLISHTSPEEIGEEIWANSLKANTRQLSPLARLEYSVTFLKKIGVDATWTAGKNGPLFHVVTNPYKERYPQSQQGIVDSLIQKAIQFAEGK
jgi:hypothetical protein